MLTSAMAAHGSQLPWKGARGWLRAWRVGVYPAWLSAKEYSSKDGGSAQRVWVGATRGLRSVIKAQRVVRTFRTLVRGGVVSWPALTAGVHRYVVGADRDTRALERDLGGCLAGRGFDAGAR